MSGGRPPLPPEARASAAVRVRLTAAESARLRDYAAAEGLTVSAYVRLRCLGLPIAPPGEATIADSIARSFDYDGRTVERDGVCIEDALAAHCAGQVSLKGAGTVHVLRDGSAIVTTEEEWDTVAQNDDGHWVSTTDILRDYGPGAE